MSWSQTALDNTRRTLQRSPLHPFRALKRLMPRGLFGRSLLIIITPMLILQAVVTAVFFDRHYRIVTATIRRQGNNPLIPATQRFGTIAGSTSATCPWVAVR